MLWRNKKKSRFRKLIWKWLHIKAKPSALYKIYLTLASMKYISHYTKILNMINILIFDHYFAPINEQWLNFDLGKTRKSVDKSWPSVFVCVWEGHASSCWLGRPLNQMTGRQAGSVGSERLPADCIHHRDSGADPQPSSHSPLTS